MFQTVRRTVNTVRRVVARYDAARTTDDNQRHWLNADNLSANSANSAAVRRILRSRARYEVANNTYARGIAQTLANYSIGTGPRLQMLLPDKNNDKSNDMANKAIESKFNEWARNINLAEKLRTMRLSRCSDGEAFAVFTTNSKLKSEVKLDLKLIEADQVATPFGETTLSGVDGIEFDSEGNPSHYWVMRSHPGDMVPTFKADPYPAEQVIHWYRADRPGQARAVPEITAALPLFAQLRRYTLAVISAAETAASIAGIVQSDAPYDPNDPDAAAWQRIEYERNALMTVPGGMKVAQLKAEQPTSTYGDFKNQIINEIARCLEIPFNVAAGNSAGYNYASGRLDYQMFYKALRIEQSQLEIRVLDRIFTAWLDEALLIPGYLPDGITPIETKSHTWFFDGLEHVDPAKEASAQGTRLQNYTTTLADEYAKQGKDWETQLRQRAKELALQYDLGLPLPSSNQSLTKPDPSTTDPTEDTNVDPEEELATA